MGKKDKVKKDKTSKREKKLQELEKGISKSRKKRRERGIWQRRFWAHLIEDQEDYSRHVDYIHWNPIKHGWVNKVRDWPYSSFHRYVKQDIYTEEWGNNEKPEIDGIE